MSSPNYLQHLTDEELIEHLIQTDGESAFNTLYQRHWWAVYHYVFKRLKQRDLSEDIVQEIFLSVWKNRQRLDKSKILLAYLFSAARNRIYEALRKGNLAGEYLRRAESLYAVTDSSLEEDFSAWQLKKTIFSYVSQMPDKGKAAFLLSREQGMSVPEIARHLQIAPKTVEWHIAKVSLQVKSFLEKITLLLLF